MTLTKDEIERYSRHILLREVGAQGQQKLKAASVLVVGAGGIGSPALFYLAAAGIGRIGIVDPDRVALSNLQRQILHDADKVGTRKTESAASALARLNPDIAVSLHPVRFDDSNAADLFDGYDLVLEGVDNFETRYAINRAAIAARKPLISAAVGRFSGQLATFKPWAAPGRLPCYRCFVPEQPPRDDQFNCEEDGILGPVTGIMGTLAAMEVLKEILGLGQSLAGRLFLHEALTTQSRTITVPADPACPDCGPLSG